MVTNPADSPLPPPPPGSIPLSPHSPLLAPPVAPDPASTRTRTSPSWPIITGVVAVTLTAGLLGTYLGASAANRQLSGNSVSSSLVSVPAGPTTPPAAGSVAAAAAKAGPSVVRIEGGANSTVDHGSGVIIRADGYVLTNSRVAGTGPVTVRFADGSRATATLVGTSPEYDLAVVKVTRTGLPTAHLGSSATVHVGDIAIAIGSPLSLDGTVTAGIISAINRPVTTGQDESEASYINAIQTDAPINPGNSGGPLVNGSGEVVGINTANATLGSNGGISNGSIGLGFAIPVDTAARIAREIIATGHASTPKAGVTLDMSSDVATILSVDPSGPGARGGLRPGDVVERVDGRRVSDSIDLVVALRAHQPGDTVTLTVRRGAATTDLKVKLSAG